jgi:hypothetical protein
VALTLIAIGSLLSAFASPAGADVCQVPSTPYPTIQSAIDDAVCGVVLVSAGQYPEHLVIDRSLDLIGDSVEAVEITGSATVTGSSSQVHLEELRIELDAVGGSSPPEQALLVENGAEVTTDDVDVVRRSWPEGFIFFDGFETGTTDQWSHQNP